MSRSSDAGIIIYFVLFFIFFGGVFLYKAWCASMEAQAYNEVTGKEVTVWQAIFLDLRVQSEPK